MKARHNWAALDGTPTHSNALEGKCMGCGLVRMRDGISTVYVKGQRFWTKAPACKGRVKHSNAKP